MHGLGGISFGLYYLSSAPQVIRGKVVVVGGVLDNQLWGSPSGVIRAYDAVTGELAWAFDVGRPDRRGAPAAGEVYTLSTPNSWAPVSAERSSASSICRPATHRRTCMADSGDRSTTSSTVR
jgi:quinoprotein glucose dehydrogenase